MSENKKAGGKLPVAEQKRQELFKSMTDATKEVAQDFEKKLGKVAEGLVMIRYDIGARIIKVTEAEGVYGTSAVAQLANYLQFPGGESGLYTLKMFAQTFDRKFVQDQIAEPMSNGRPLDTGHFIAIAKVTSKKEQQKLFARVRQDCISVNALEEEVRAAHETRKKGNGGRKPSVSSNPLSNLQKLFGLSQKLDNFLAPFGDGVLTALEEVAPEEVSDRLLQKFSQAREQLEETVNDCNSTLELMKPVEERLTRVLDEAGSTSEADDTEEDEEEEEEGEETEETEEGDEAEGEAADGAKSSGKKSSGKKSADSGKKSSGKKSSGKKSVKAEQSKGAKSSKGGKASRRPAAV